MICLFVSLSLVRTQKFAASIKKTMQHIEGEVRLDVPDIDWPSDDPDVNVRHDQVRQKVEDTCRNWHKQISSALDVLQNKTHQVCVFVHRCVELNEIFGS